jgi:hypothetical protein
LAAVGETEKELEEESKILYGAKFFLSKQRGWTPKSSFILQGFTPTYGVSNLTTMSATQVFGWQLRNGWVWDNAFRYATSGFEDDHFNVWSPSTVVKITLTERLKVHADLAYYDFQNVQGALSQPCSLVNGNTDCSTDTSRPGYMQKGNTLFLVRDIIPDPANPLNYAQPQYVGLGFEYQVLDLIAGVDWKIGQDGLKVSGEAQYLRNLAYDQSELCRYAPFGLPVNNLTPSAAGNVNPCAATAPDKKAQLDTGDTGWMVRGAFGYGEPRQRGQWNVAAGYRYLETDAVLDAYTDNEFHLGGTNAQGYFLSGSYALYDNTLVSLRWLSANEVSGPPLQIDVTQFDILIGF